MATRSASAAVRWAWCSAAAREAHLRPTGGPPGSEKRVRRILTQVPTWGKTVLDCSRVAVGPAEDTAADRQRADTRKASESSAGPVSFFCAVYRHLRLNGHDSTIRVVKPQTSTARGPRHFLNGPRSESGNLLMVYHAISQLGRRLAPWFRPKSPRFGRYVRQHELFVYAQRARCGSRASRCPPEGQQMT